MKSQIRETLNEIRWTKQGHYEEYKIIFRHRGAPNDEKEVNFSKMIDITASFFVYKESEHDFETYIPFHRILKIINIKNNEILWIKK